jgi:Lon protease-like protein
MVDLPNVIALFPLPNAVLFPGMPLPLHIFEPRYREMVREVSKRDDRLIGMVLLRGDWRRAYYDRPDVFTVGCAGRMMRVDPLADGRYNILLQGVREFEIGEEVGERTFREATVRWRPAPADSLSIAERTRMKGLVERLLGDGEPGLARKLLDDASASDELMVNVFCHALQFSPIEKQALLEAGSLVERARRLCEVIQFSLDAGGLAADADEWRH